MITEQEILMGRVKKEDLSPELKANLAKLLTAINIVRTARAKAMTVASGYRSKEFNASIGGAPHSFHVKCLAVDIADPKQEFQKWIMANLDVVRKAGLQLEPFSHTKTWVHFDLGHRAGVDVFFKM